MRLLTALALSAILTSCAYAPFWPKLNSDTGTKVVNPPPCMTDHLQTAKNCALATIAEMAKMLGQVGDTERANAYFLWAVGTATGAGLALDWGRGFFRGIGLGTASLLGLNALVQPAAQAQILEKYIRRLQCAYKAADGVDNAAGNARVWAVRSMPLNSEQEYLTMLRETNPLTVGSRMSLEQERTARAMALTASSAQDVAKEIVAQRQGAGTWLSNEVLGVRRAAQRELTALFTSKGQETVDQERDRVVEVIAGLLRMLKEARDANKEVETKPGTGGDGDTKTLLESTGESADLVKSVAGDAVAKMLATDYLQAANTLQLRSNLDANSTALIQHTAKIVTLGKPTLAANEMEDAGEKITKAVEECISAATMRALLK